METITLILGAHYAHNTDLVMEALGRLLWRAVFSRMYSSVIYPYYGRRESKVMITGVPMYLEDRYTLYVPRIHSKYVTSPKKEGYVVYKVKVDKENLVCGAFARVLVEECEVLKSPDNPSFHRFSELIMNNSLAKKEIGDASASIFDVTPENALKSFGAYLYSQDCYKVTVIDLSEIDSLITSILGGHIGHSILPYVFIILGYDGLEYACKRGLIDSILRTVYAKSPKSSCTFLLRCDLKDAIPYHLQHVDKLIPVRFVHQQ